MTDRATPDAASDTTDLFEIIRTTRSMRRLKPDPVPNELIRKILEAGVCAPSGGNMQRWQFLVIRDPKGQGDGRSLVQACVGRAGCPTVSVG
jgi:nitroreductase